MRSSILLLVLSATVFAGCSSAYKTGQTPDDVYFSPQRQHDEYVSVKESDNSHYFSNDEYYNEDQYLRMKVHNRVEWSQFDDWYNYSPSYSYMYYNTLWSSPWTPYTYWNYYYNPYCSPVIIGSKAGTVYNHPRIFNLNSYNSTLLTNQNYTNPKGGSLYNNNYNNYNNTFGKPVKVVGVNNSNNNSGSGAGNFLRNIFNGSSSSSSSGSSGSVGGRSSGGSSGGSGGGGSAPVRRF